MASSANTNEFGKQLEDYEKVIRGLPLMVPEKLFESNPRFKKLLLKLTEHINSSGESHEKALKLEKVYKELKENRKKFLYCSLQYTELEEMVDNYDINCNEAMPDSELQEFFETLKNLLSDADILAYFEVCPLLGIPLDFIKESKIKVPLNFEETVREKLEEHLESKLESFLIMYHEEFVEDAALKDSFKLPLLIRAHKKELVELQENLKIARQKNACLLWKFYKILMRNLEITSAIVEKYRTRPSPVKNFDIVKVWKIRTEKLKQQIRFLELKIKRYTYNRQTVKALRTIKTHLDEDKEKTKIETEKAKETLARYEALGNEFKELVKEYKTLKESINNKKWAVSNLVNA